MTRRVMKYWKLLKNNDTTSIISLYKQFTNDDDPEDFEIDLIKDKESDGSNDDAIVETIESCSNKRKGKHRNSCLDWKNYLTPLPY